MAKFFYIPSGCGAWVLSHYVASYALLPVIGLLYLPGPLPWASVRFLILLPVFVLLWPGVLLLLILVMGPVWLVTGVFVGWEHTERAIGELGIWYAAFLVGARIALLWLGRRRGGRRKSTRSEAEA